MILKFLAHLFKLGLQSSRNSTELQVEHQLERILSRRGYIIFGDLIIPSVSKKIPSTQIDHVVVSLYGIFCIEIKSHKGNIYGSYKARYWKQYLGGSRPYEFYNPIKQNSHHVKSLEYLLRSRLKSPIHSYVVFPNAHRIKIGGKERIASIEFAIDRILNHTRQVYTPDDVEAIAKGLAYVSTQSANFRERHVDAVREYIEMSSK